MTRTARRRAAAALALAALASTAGARSVFAEDYGYTDPGDDWNVAANWIDTVGGTGVVPGVSDTAYIGSDYPAGSFANSTVSVSTAVSVGTVYLGYNANTSGGLSLLPGGSLTSNFLIVGEDGTGTVNRLGGLLITTSLRVGDNSSLDIITGDTVVGGGTWDIIGPGAALNYDNDNSVAAIFATNVYGDATFNLDGGTLRTAILAIGGSTSGGTFVRGGGTLDVEYINIQGLGGTLDILSTDTLRGVSTITLTGAGSTLNYNNTPLASYGTSFVNSGATLNLQGGTFISNYLTVDGTILRNGGLLDIGGNVVINGGSTLNVAAGDSFTNATIHLAGPNADINLGGNDLTAATLHVSGAGSDVTRGVGGNVNTTNLTVADGGSFALAAGDSLATGGTINVFGAGSTLDVNTPIPNTSAQAQVYNGGVINLNGNTLHTDHLTVGSSTPGTINRGAGGTLDVKTLHVGGGSALGILPVDTIQAGGQFFVSGGATLSYDNNSTGPVNEVLVFSTLVLAGGTLHTNTLFVGNTGAATVTRSGGLLDVQASATLSDGCDLDIVAGDTFTNATLTAYVGSTYNLNGNDVTALGLNLYGGGVNRGAGGNVNLTNLTLESGSTFSIESGDSLASGGLISVRQNGSILDFNAAIANTLATTTVNDDGTINLNGNTLRTSLLQIGNSTPGTLTRGAGGNIEVQSLVVTGGSTFGFQSTDTILGGGNFAVFGAGSTLTLNHPFVGVLNNAHAYDGGTLDLASGVLNTSAFQLGNSTAGNLTRSGTGGTLMVTSFANIFAGSTLTLAAGDSFGGASILVHPASTIDLNGTTLTALTLDLAGGSITRAGGNIHLANLQVRLDADFSIESGDSIAPGGSITVFDAGATVDMNSALANTLGNVLIYNDGALNLNSNTLRTNTLQVGSSTPGTLVRGGGLLDVQNVSVFGGSTLDLVPGDTLQAGATLQAVGPGSTLNYNNSSPGPVASAVAFAGGTLNLNGGTLTTGGGTPLQGNTDSTLNFNGTTLKAAAATTGWINGFTNAYVQTGGAKFNTNGFEAFILQPLDHDPALGATPDGGLTKNGLGRLRLTGINTYTGNTVVNQGALFTLRPSNLPGYNVPGKVIVHNGAALELSVGGASEWDAGGVDAVRANATLNPGAALGLNTAHAVGGTFTYTPSISGVYGITKLGTGTLDLTAGTHSYTGGTRVEAGTLLVNRLHANNAVTVTGGTLQVVESAPGYSSGLPAGDNAFVSQPTSLAVAEGAVLDITNNDVVIDYSGASPAAAYEALVASGYNVVGDWQGDGIVSSVAAIDGNYVVAIADNAMLAAPFGTAQGGPLFAGVDVDLDTILIKFTHRADVNLDGLVTPDDSAVFGGNYDESITSGHTWALGDMNYDGMCTPDDAAIFGGAYDESLASLPEPGCLGALGFAGVIATRRSRKSRR